MAKNKSRKGISKSSSQTEAGMQAERDEAATSTGVTSAGVTSPAKSGTQMAREAATLSTEDDSPTTTPDAPGIEEDAGPSTKNNIPDSTRQKI